MRTVVLVMVLSLSLAQVAFAQVPNMRTTVDAVYASAPWDLTTKTGTGCFTEAVAYRLHQLDPNWGHLAKFSGQNQWNGHAVDAVLYKSGYAVDIVGSSESPNAKPGWTVDRDAATKQPIARYTNNAKYFVTPTTSCAPNGPAPEPTPDPPVVDLDPLKKEIAALRAAYAVLEGNFAKVVTIVETLQQQIDTGRAEREALADRIGTHDGLFDSLYRDVQTIKSRPIPDGCVANFTRCRLTFNAPPLP